MADYSVILQSPELRSLVQDNSIMAVFKDGLYPKNLYRQECTIEEWGANAGDDKLVTRAGLMTVSLLPTRPGVDPSPGDYTAEQWRAVMQPYDGTIDTNIASAVVAAVNKLLVDSKRLGEQCATTLNRNIRERLHNAAQAGSTVADGTQSTVTTLRVKRLNGFTRARRPDLAAGSPVRYEPVTTSNPLKITVGVTAAVVTGFTPDYSGDEIGPGTLTLLAAVSATDRDAVVAATTSYILRSGGGNRIDALAPGTDLLTFKDIQSAIARLAGMNVPKMADGTYHVHLDQTSKQQLFNDTQWQNILRGNIDSSQWADYVFAKTLGCTFFENNEQPQVALNNVLGASTATYDPRDPAGWEMWTNGTTTGAPVHRVHFVGMDAITEYWLNQDVLLTEAGVSGKVEPGIRLDNNGFSMTVERVQTVWRAPQDRKQEFVAQTWKFKGDWQVGTDGATGDAAVYKRVLDIEHTE